MYTPSAFVVDDIGELHRMMQQCRTVQFVTATDEGPLATLLPTVIADDEGDNGVLYAHLARANVQWKVPPIGHALAVFTGPEAYITPSWYASKAEHGKVVPTWNYTAVHASGPVEFFDDPERLLDAVDRLTNYHEQNQERKWSVSDAPATFISALLRGIVGIRMPIAKLEGKRKMSQNRSEADRQGVKLGLARSNEAGNLTVASMIPD